MDTSTAIMLLLAPMTGADMIHEYSSLGTDLDAKEAFLDDLQFFSQMDFINEDLITLLDHLTEMAGEEWGTIEAAHQLAKDAQKIARKLVCELGSELETEKEQNRAEAKASALYDAWKDSRFND